MGEISGGMVNALSVGHGKRVAPISPVVGKPRVLRSRGSVRSAEAWAILVPIASRNSPAN